MCRSSSWIGVVFGRRTTSSDCLMGIAAEKPDIEISVARVKSIA
jgi:hypothetical protein